MECRLHFKSTPFCSFSLEFTGQKKENFFFFRTNEGYRGRREERGGELWSLSQLDSMDYLWSFFYISSS